MADDIPGETAVLLVRQGGRSCAIPLASVVECMRPLPVEPAQELPPFLRGLAVIRGTPVPVVDLGALAGARSDAPPGRYVVLRVNGRRVALAVDGVLGVRRLDGSVLGGLPPLLQDTNSESVATVAVLDERLLLALRPAKVIPDELWLTLEANGSGHDSTVGS